jgi:collagen type VII alpha
MLKLVLLLSLVTGCGSDLDFTNKPGEDGKDGKSIVGPTGKVGLPGTDSEPCSVSDTGLVSCPDGSSYQIPAGVSGQPGKDGLDGAAGEPGQAGTSCTVQAVDNGAVISCSDGTSVVVLNGSDGTDGTVGAYSIVGMIDPCGDQPGFDELLLRLADGSLIAHYSHGNKQFLTVIGPGSYQTTDGHSCNFTVTQTLDVTW